MSGLLGLSGSLSPFLSPCYFSLFSLAITPLFPCYCISHTIFLPFFQVSKCSCLIYLCLTLFQSAQIISSGTILLLSLFIWILISSRSAPLLNSSSTQFSSAALNFFALMLFFSSLSQIPFSSLFPLPISCFSSFLYISPSFMFLFPVHPHMIQRDHFAHLALSLQTSFPLQPRTFPCSFSSTLLFLLSCLFFSFSFSVFYLYLFPVLSKAFFLMRVCVLSRPTFTWER